MYDIPRRRLIDNPISRYFVGDRTPGLKYNQHGSLDIYTGPGPPTGLESNGTRTSEGFFLLFRVYGPEEAVFERSFALPDIERID